MAIMLLFTVEIFEHALILVKNNYPKQKTKTIQTCKTKISVLQVCIVYRLDVLKLITLK